jgi:predicted house-cleaning NTP pyrophosphatase (Maf/HAM1 superfamily)
LKLLKSVNAKRSIVPPKSDEDIEEWAKQYPDVAGIVETIAAKKAQEMFRKLKSSARAR